MKLFQKKSEAQASNADKPKSIQQILNEQIETSLHEFNRPYKNLFVSAFGGGLEIGFSVLFMAAIFGLIHESVSQESLKIYLALCYPIGFIFVIIGRSELFTEHTALALIPVLNRSVGLTDLLKLWGVIYLGNIIGGLIFALILISMGPAIGFADHHVFHHLASELISYKWNVILMSALLAGWMMGLLGWLLTSSKETISRIILIILITFIIGVAGLHHCIVGSIEVLAGLFSSEEISFLDYLRFQVWASIGNAIGGSVFVAIIKFSHIRGN